MNKGQNSSIRLVLSVAPFRYLWFGQICSQLSINVLMFVLALRLYQITGSNTAVAGLFLTFGIPAVLFGMVAGTIVEKLDNRKILATCDILRAIMVSGFLFLPHSSLVMYLLAFINAVITQFYVPAEAPTIPLLIPKETLLTANSLFSFTYYTSMAAGSIVAGPMLKLLGPSSIFIFIILLFSLAAWFASRLPREKNLSPILPLDLSRSGAYLFKRFIASFREGIVYIRSSKVLFNAVLLLTGTQVILVILASLAPGFADRILGIDVRDASLFIIGPAILGIMVGALWTGQRGNRYKPSTLIRTGITSAGILLIIVSLIVWLKRVQAASGFFQNPILVLTTVVFLFLLLGIANSLLDVPANSLLQQYAQESMRSRVYGLLTAAVGGVGLLPVVIGGVLADTIGIGKVIFLLGIIVFVFGILSGKHLSKVS